MKEKEKKKTVNNEIIILNYLTKFMTRVLIIFVLFILILFSKLILKLKIILKFENSYLEIA